MATIAEPVKSPKASARGASARRRYHIDEIVGLIAFCAVLLIVYLMRNYAS
jgi:hypothetical protein